MNKYQHSSSENEPENSIETYSYLGIKVIIITVFRADNIAIVEDINTGEQFEVFRDQLY